MRSDRTDAPGGDEPVTQTPDVISPAAAAIVAEAAASAAAAGASSQAESTAQVVTQAGTAVLSSLSLLQVPLGEVELARLFAAVVRSSILQGIGGQDDQIPPIDVGASYSSRDTDPQNQSMRRLAYAIQRMVQPMIAGAVAGPWTSFAASVNQLPPVQAPGLWDNGFPWNNYGDIFQPLAGYRRVSASRWELRGLVYFTGFSGDEDVGGNGCAILATIPIEARPKYDKIVPAVMTGQGAKRFDISPGGTVGVFSGAVSASLGVTFDSTPGVWVSLEGISWDTL